MGGACSMFDGNKKYVIQFKNFQRKVALGRLGRGWEDNIKSDLKEIGWKGMNYIEGTSDIFQWWAPSRVSLRQGIYLLAE